MRFSIVIPTYQRLAKLEACLAALEAQIDAPAFEIIVVFDGPDPHGQARIEALGRELALQVQVLSQPNAGPAAARNRGARAAGGDRLLFLGDDIIAHPRLLAEHAAVAPWNDVAALGYVPWAESARPTRFMRYLAPDRGPQFHYAGIEDPSDCGFEYCYTANFAVPLAWWGAEPFDEGFRHAACEDLEWSLRLWKRLHARIVFAPRAIGYHDHHLTLRQFLRRQRTAGASAARLWRLHPELRGMVSLFPPTWYFFSTSSGRGRRDRMRQAHILARHYSGLPVRDEDYFWLVMRPYLGALIAELGDEYTCAEIAEEP